MSRRSLSLQWTLVHGRPYDPVHQMRYCNTISKATDKQYWVIKRELWISDFKITRSDSRTALLWSMHQDEHRDNNSQNRYVVMYLPIWFGSLGRTKHVFIYNLLWTWSVYFAKFYPVLNLNREASLWCWKDAVFISFGAFYFVFTFLCIRQSVL